MIGFLKKLWRDRRGNALVLAGAALPLVIGSAGLATDTIEWALWKRQLQRVADSGAEAGVYAIAAGNTVDNCSTVGAATYSAPVAYDVQKNNHLPQVPTCVATNPPSVGSYTSDSNAVRVTVSMQRPLSFSGMFLSSAPVITASSTATIVPGGHYCVISLEPGAVTGIDATGSTNVNLGCGMITNSTSLSAAVATGSSSVTASPIAAVGGIPASTHWGSGTVLQPFTIAEADPFGSVPLPTPTNCSAFPNNQPNSTLSLGTTAGFFDSNGVKCFNSDINVKGTVTLANGIYVLDGGAGMSMTNTGASLTCLHCTFIIMNSSGGTVGTVSLQGGNLTLGSPMDGAYKGMLFYQSRTATSDNSVKINGNSTSALEGALYFPKADLTFNGTTGMSTNCLQIVSKDVQFTGNSAISNHCDAATQGGKDFTGRKVRLVE
jgi:Flp pilus assembly protein TadG